MNYIFAFLILTSVVFGAASGRLEDVTNAMLVSCQRAVEVSIGLIGIMAFWLGITKIAQKSGLVELFSKLISPVLGFIFDELPKNSPAFSNIALNIAANALGLMNAATPFGIKAMKDLKSEGEVSLKTAASEIKKSENSATNSMCIFLAMNTAGFQLVPAAVLAILAAFGAENPAEIIIPTFIVTFSSFIFAIVTAKILAGVWKAA